jgi:predicted DNA-binding transcriptional regulator YafY
MDILDGVSRPTTRVLAMLELLQDRQYVTGPELVERLEVDARTVRRYVTKLQELGIPVEATRGRHGGYRLRPGYKLPPLMLTDEEATAVVLGLVSARHSGIGTAMPAAEGALAKLRRVLPPELRERTLALQESLGFSRELPGAPPATDTVLTLADAVRSRRRVRISYADREGNESERELDPYGLVFHWGRWYLSAYDHLRADRRTFRIDRVSEAALLRASAPLPAGFDPVEHVTTALTRVPRRYEIEVVHHTTLAEARRRIPRGAARLEPAEGGVVSRGSIEDIGEMARILAGLPWDFTIVAPAELSEALATHARRLAKLAR